MKPEELDADRDSGLPAEGPAEGAAPEPALKGARPGWHFITVGPPSRGWRRADRVLERTLTELVRYYRHSSVGRRCLGIAHQMNTPLQVLTFQLDLLEQKSRQEEDLPGGAGKPAAAPRRRLHRDREERFGQMRQEVQKLQNFSRTLVLQGVHEDTQAKIPLSLNRVYRQELELYEAEAFYKHQVEKEFRWGEDLPRINGHYIDFSQSFRNLMDNALEAMEGRDRRRLTVETAYRQGRIVVRLGDTGKGIPPGALPWIFEPFFTTKRTGGREGAGLGLFMVRRLLTPYLGEIRVDSAPGGTWVSLSLVVA